MEEEPVRDRPAGLQEDPVRDRPTGQLEDPVRDRPAGLQEDPVRDRPTGGTASKSPRTMPQPFRAPVLKLKHFWESHSPSTPPPRFWDWLRRFDNWFKLQYALCPDSQKLPPVV